MPPLTPGPTELVTPVVYDPTLHSWIVSRYEDARRVARDYATFSQQVSPVRRPAIRSTWRWAESILPAMTPCERSSPIS